MIRRQEVKTYVETLICDKCGGQMVFTGEGLLTYPSKFPHICMECNNKTIENKIYPSTEHEYINSNE